MLQALRDEVIVSLVYEEHKGLIEIPRGALKYRQYDGAVYGVVVSVGPRNHMGLFPGDKIIFVRNEGVKFAHEGRHYLKLKSRWLLGKLDA